MSFLLVDRILSLDPGRNVLAHKYITPNDTYLYTGRSGQPALIPAVIGETLGQAAAWSVMRACDFQYRPVAGVVDEVIMHDDAYVGETLILEATIERWDDQAVEYYGTARVDDRVIFTIKRALGPMLPMTDFIDFALIKLQFAALDQIVEAPIVSEHFALKACPYIGFDRILQIQEGESLIAEKFIDPNAPYFPDHFPQKPVLPLTILLASKIQLAQQFLAASLGDEQANAFLPTHVRKIKMNEFVPPGSTVNTQLKVKEMTENRVIINFRSEVAGKRVCVCEVEFGKILL